MAKSAQLGFIKIALIFISIVALGVAVYAVTVSTQFRQHAAEGAILYLTGSPQTAKSGDKVDVSLDVETQSTPIYSVSVNLTYPANKLSFQNFDFDNSSFDMIAENVGGNGYIQLTRQASSPINGKNHVATIHFLAKDTVSLTDIQPVSGIKILSMSDRNLYTNAISRKSETPLSKPSTFSVQFFVQFFQNIFKNR